MKVKEIIKGYETESGHAPVSGVIDTLTFGKYVPFYLLQSIAVAVLSFVLINIAIWVYLDGLALSVLLSFGSLLGSVYLLFTGVFYFVFKNFINNIEGIILGTVEPIEKVYEKYKNKTSLSKKEFVITALKEEVFPVILNSVPFLKTSKKSLESIFNGITESVEKQPETNGSYAEKLNFSFEKAKLGVTKPYMMALKVYGVFSLLIVLLILI